jgi:hypothetical protein
MFPMLKQIDQGCARAIRCSKDIDLLVPQRRPHVIKIVRKDRCCVLRQVRRLRQLFTAGSQPFL